MISQAPVENIQQLINKININLDKAESLLANELPTQTITSATSSASQTNLTTNSSSLNTMKVRIIADEAEEPYMPGSIIINNGDKVSWINTDVEAHTVTSGLASST